jgi:hypothetical protein
VVKDPTQVNLQLSQEEEGVSFAELFLERYYQEALNRLLEKDPERAAVEKDLLPNMNND